MTAEDCKRELRAFMNEDGRLTAMPSKYRRRLYAAYYLGTKVEAGREYTERELNLLIDEWALFHDAASLRRDMYDLGLLDRERDGSVYRRAEVIPPLEEFIAAHI